MSTRSTICYRHAGEVEIHLYHEVLDSMTYLEITGPVQRYVNIVIPEWAVDGLKEILSTAPHEA